MNPKIRPLKKRNRGQKSWKQFKKVFFFTSFSLFILVGFFGIVIFDPSNSDLEFNGGGRELLSKSPSIHWLHKIPRNTLQAKSVEPSLFVADGSDYYSSLAAVAIVAFTIGFVSLIAAVSFCCCRYYLDLCGGIEAKESGYSVRERVLVKVFIFILAVFLMVIIIAGLIGNTQFDPGLKTFFDNLQNESEIQATIIESIQPRLLEVDYNQTMLKGFVAAVNYTASTTVQDGQKGRNYLTETDSGRLAILGLSFGCVIIAILTGCIAAIFNLPKLSMITAFLSFFGIFLLWINVALHLPVSMVVADVCYDTIDVTIQVRLAERITDQGTNYSNSALDGICYCGGWDNLNKTYGYAEDLRLQYLEQQQGIENQSSISQNDIQTYYDLQSKIDILESVEEDSLYVRDCDWLLAVFDPVQDKMCGEQLSGIVLIWASSFVLSILLIPYTIFAIMGFKRFSRVVVDDGFF